MNKVLKMRAMKVINTKKGFFSEFCIKDYDSKILAKFKAPAMLAYGLLVYLPIYQHLLKIAKHE